jgi:hypothetical protein
MQRVRQTYVYGILGGEPPNIWSYTFIYVVYVVYIMFRYIYVNTLYIYKYTLLFSDDLYHFVLPFIQRFSMSIIDVIKVCDCLSLA